MTLSYSVDSGTRINNRGLGKPNEDFFFVDRERHVFILLDGITRVHKEYQEIPGRSAACDVGEIFLNTARDYIAAHRNDQAPEALLRNAALLGNAAIVPYRRQKELAQWQYYPGVLGILAVLEGDRLHYAYVGDSISVHIRGSEKTYFGCQEQLETIAKLRTTKAEMYANYCNHPENPLGYGIFNGDESVSPLLEQGVITLQPGDTVIFSSDGLTQYLRHTDAAVLAGATVEEMMDASVIYDQPPYASYADDKAAIKLSFR